MADTVEVGVQVNANTQTAQQRIEQLRAAIRTAFNELQALNAGVVAPASLATSSLASVGTAAGLAATGSQLAVQAVTGLIRTFVDLSAEAAKATFKIGREFEQAMNEFRGVTASTAEVMALVSDRAKALGNDLTLPATSAAGAAQAMVALAKGGLSVKDSLDAARGTLQLAAAAGVDGARAAEIQAAALNAFALSGKEAVRVADLLAAAAGAGAGDIGDYAESLKQASAVSANAKIPIQDLVTEIALLAKNGILGSDAGTSLKTMILRLTAPAEDAKRVFRQLGIELTNAKGEFIGLRESIAQIDRALVGLNDSQRADVFVRIFGEDAIRAAQILQREGVAGFDAVAKALDKTGAAADLAAARTRGLGGALLGLQSQAEGVGIAIYEAFAGSFEGIVRAAAEYIGNVVKYFEENKREADEVRAIISQIGEYLRDFFEISIKIFELDNPVAVAAEIKTILNITGALLQLVGDLVIAVEAIVKGVRILVDPIGFFNLELAKANAQLKQMGVLVDDVNKKSREWTPPGSGPKSEWQPQFGQQPQQPQQPQMSQDEIDARAQRRRDQLKEEADTREMLRLRALEVQKQIAEDEREIAAANAKRKLDLEGKLAEQRRVLAQIRLQQTQADAQAEINEVKRLVAENLLSRESANERIIESEKKRRDAVIAAAKAEFDSYKTQGLDPDELATKTIQKDAKILAAQREFNEKEKAILAEGAKARLEARYEEGRRLEEIRRLNAANEIEQQRAMMGTTLLSEKEFQQKVFQERLNQLKNDRDLLEERRANTKEGTEEYKKLSFEIQKIDIAVVEARAESTRKNKEIDDRELAQRRAFQNQLRELSQQAAGIYLEIQRQQFAQSVALFSRREQRLIEQANLDVEAENQRYQNAVKSLEAQREEQIANEQNEERKLEIKKTYNALIEAEEAQHQEFLNQIRTNTTNAIEALNPAGPDALFGSDFARILEETGSAYQALAEVVAQSLDQMSRQHGNFGSIARNAFAGMATAIGQTVKSYVLLGQTGTAILRRIAAETLATIAQQAAVKAIYELAEGFAMLFLNPAAAAAHFKAAALYGVVAVTAGVAGRAVAGNLFQTGGASSGGGGSLGSGGSGTTTNDQRQPTTINAERNVIVLRINGRAERGVIIETIAEDFRANGVTRQIIQEGGR